MVIVDGVRGLWIGNEFVLGIVIWWRGEVGCCNLGVVVEDVKFRVRLGELFFFVSFCLGLWIEIWVGDVGKVLLIGFWGILMWLGDFVGFEGWNWGDNEKWLLLLIFGIDCVCIMGGGVRFVVDLDCMWLLDSGEDVWGWYVSKDLGVYVGEIGEDKGEGLVDWWIVGGFCR